MKKSKLILWLLNLIFITTAKGQLTENLKNYGLFARDSLVGDSAVIVNGKAKGLKLTTQNFISDSSFQANDSLADFEIDSILYSIDTTGFQNVNLSSSITLNPGSYLINQNTLLNHDLTLTGDSNSLYIFYISGNLNVDGNFIFFTSNVESHNIYWIVLGESHLDRSMLSGNLISRGNTYVSNSSLGMLNIFSLGNIFILKNSINESFYNYKILLLRDISNRIPLTNSCSNLPQPCTPILNGSFEDNNGIPQHISSFNGWVCNWFNPTNSTPDYFTTSSPLLPIGYYKDPNPSVLVNIGSVAIPTNGVGTQTTHTGNAYVGIIVWTPPAGLAPQDYHEYIETQFSAPLVAGKYFVSYYVSYAEQSPFVIDRFGAYFSSSPVTQNNYQTINVNPQVESNPGTLVQPCGWIELKNCFTASGGEEYMTLGNFHNQSSTHSNPNPYCAGVPHNAYYNIHSFAYYYIDDVTLYKLPDEQNFTYSTTCGVPIVIGPTQSQCSVVENGMQYSWSPTLGLSSTNVKNPTFVISSPGTYHYQVTLTYRGCSTTDQIDIVVPGPTASISQSSTTFPCQPPHIIQLTANPPGSTYSWVQPSGIPANSQTINANQIGNYSVTINSNGCISTASVILSDPPPVSLTVTPSSTTICSNTSTTLNANCTNCSSNSYSWSPNVGSTSLVTVAPLGNTQYTVVGSNSYGCTASATASVSVISPVLYPTITGPTSHCDNDATIYTISNWTIASSPYFTWSAVSSNGSVVSVVQVGGSNQSVQVNWPPDQGGTITVTYGIPGCQNTSTFYVQTCCKGVNSIILHDGDTPNIITLGNATSVTNLVINGTFIIDRDFTFNFCSNIQMSPGSRILVRSGKAVVFNHCNLFPTSECCKMWKGIELESGPFPFLGAKIEFNDSKIYQAEYGINAKEQCRVYVKGSEFVDDYVGIKLASEFLRTNIDFFIANSKFYSQLYGCSPTTPPTSNFVGKYLGQSTTIGTLPFTGILAVDLNNLSVSNTVGPLGNIEFHDLSNGIIATNIGALSISNSKFTNMIVDQTYMPLVNAFNGCGIRVTNCAVSTVQGLGGNFPTPVLTFKNCEYGVYFASVNGNIFNVGTDFDVRTAVYLTRCRKISIYDNSLCARIFGLHTLLNQDFSRIIVYHNDFRNSFITNYASGTNVFLDEGLNTFIDIHDNHIILNHAIQGVFARNNINTRIVSNLVDMNWLGSTTGIKFQGKKTNVIQCNTVSSPAGSTNVNQSGIYLALVQNTVVGGNIVENQNIGLNFNGSCTNSTVELNTMNTHKVGFGIYFNGNIGQQFNNTNLPYYNNGNIWNGTYSNYGAFLGNPTSPRRNQNEFHYDVNGAFNFPPSTNTPPNSWFISNGIPDLDFSTYRCTPMPLPPVTADDYIIANQLVDANTPYQEQNYESNRYLFEKLKNDPSLVQNDPILAAYFSQHFNSSIGQFGEVSVDIENAMKWQSVYTNVYDFNLELIKEKKDSVILISDSLRQDPENETLKDLLSLVNNEIGELFTSNENIKSICDQVRELQVNDLINNNENLTNEEIYESNEVAVNDIYLNTVGMEKYSLKADQITTLEGIIFQCPFSGGSSVYEARTLYSMVNDSIDYDDYDLCVFQGVAPRLNHKNPTVLSLLFPNPTSNFATLNYQIPDHPNSIFRIIDQLGKVIFEQKLLVEVNQTQIDCSSINSGIYTYQIVVDDVIQTSNLFSIVK